MRRFHRFLAVCLLASLVGLHWTLLQMAAWTGMMVRYSRDAGLREGIARTFDGRHPCPLCLTVQAGRAAERDREALAPAPKFEAVLLTSRLSVGFVAPGLPHPSWDACAAIRHFCPPKPPPRSSC